MQQARATNVNVTTGLTLTITRMNDFDTTTRVQNGHLLHLAFDQHQAHYFHQ